MSPAHGRGMKETKRDKEPQREKFYLGSDHAGFELKEKLKALLRRRGNTVVDLQEQYRERIDFPPVAERVGRAVVDDPGSYGLLVCGTGIGVTMAANKVRGVRAALLYDEEATEYARRHNDANVLTFGGRIMSYQQARRRLEAFFAHEFEGGKYADRNEYLGKIEQSNPTGCQEE